jgi:hypothetical protein
MILISFGDLYFLVSVTKDQTYLKKDWIIKHQQNMISLIIPLFLQDNHKQPLIVQLAISNKLSNYCLL